MNDQTRDELEKEGFEVERQLAAALPVAVWTLDLEIERPRTVTAAEHTVLRLLGADATTVQALTRALGLGTDDRLVERTLVALLGAGAVEAFGDGFVRTELGDAWETAGRARVCERVTYEVRLDPVHDTFHWMDDERPVYATEETWTVELPPVDDADVLRRRAEISQLVSGEGLPDEEDRAPSERRGEVELRAVAVVSSRRHWRAVRIDALRHPERSERPLIGHVAEAENPPLTALLAGFVVREKGRRVRRA
jgi:hypothetical protein